MKAVRIHLEATEEPTGPRVENIATIDGLTPSVVQAWRTSEGERDRRRKHKVWVMVIAVLLTIAALRWAPEGWLSDSLPTRVWLLGVGAVAIAAGDLLAQLRVRLWRPTTCRILATGIRQKGRLWMPAVFYEYVAEGGTYRNSAVQIDVPYSDAEGADRHRKLYVPGEQRRCFYSSRNPERAVLEQGFSYHDAGVLAGWAVGGAVIDLLF